MKEIFERLKHSPIHNYILPGLTSWMIKAGSEGEGSVRMFESTRETQEFITPHSHRYGLHCEVLQGWVRNTIWHTDYSGHYDEYQLQSLMYGGAPGTYEAKDLQVVKVRTESKTYRKGDSYSLIYSQIHSIQFSRDALVVITETEQRTDTTQILLPVAYGKAVPTFKVEPWMYKS